MTPPLPTEEEKTAMRVWLMRVGSDAQREASRLEAEERDTFQLREVVRKLNAVVRECNQFLEWI